MRALRKLQHLDLSYCMNITDANRTSIALLHQIQHLDLTPCGQPQQLSQMLAGPTGATAHTSSLVRITVWTNFTIAFRYFSLSHFFRFLLYSTRSITSALPLRATYSTEPTNQWQI
ncbi:Hypothetical protein, putative [Bodo saltans]|uniref:Uncharacterized protein n=1 Tax=Bodo saltans TaxID=75058 RepID=A0A0S4J6N0_BODSA|nr:Hypothetical protein, putative [Bodo saltans]|eukprot:CUG72418.1 Hypothetical protein, putative [Bodo saltans]